MHALVRPLSLLFVLGLPLALVRSVSAPERPVPPRPGVGQPGGPLRALTPEETALFERGRALFERDFHAR